MARMYYKIEYQSPLSRNKIAEERITLLKRGTIIPKFNTVEDLQFIEAVTVTKNNVLETFSIDRHVKGTVEIFGKYVTMTPITTKEYDRYKAAIELMEEYLTGKLFTNGPLHTN